AHAGHVCLASEGSEALMDLLIGLGRFRKQGHHREGRYQNNQEDTDYAHDQTSATCSNSLAGSSIPDALILSENVGRNPVARNLPRTRPFGPTPKRSNTKRSCIATIPSARPVTSVIWVMRREPSLRRATCTMSEMAEAIC